MITGLLFDPINPAPVRSVASDEAFARIKWTLTDREIEVFLLAADYLEVHPQCADVTGGELAHWSGRPVTHIRPRYTGLVRKGYLAYRPIRDSRAPGESRCCPAVPLVPREAVARARRERTKDR